MTDLSPEGQLPPEFLGNALVRKVAERLGPSVTVSDVAHELHKQKVPSVMLPESIRPFVEELEKKAAEARAEAENPRGKSVDAEALFLAQTLAANNALAREADKPHEAGPIKNIHEMDRYEKFGYLNKLEDMTLDEFSKLSDKDKLKHVENIEQHARISLEDAKRDDKAFTEKAMSDPALGATPEERKANLKKLSDKLDPNKIDRKDAEKIIDELPEEQRVLARERYEINVQRYFAEQALSKTERVRKSLAENDVAGAHRHMTDAAGDMRAAWEKFEDSKTKSAAYEEAAKTGDISKDTMKNRNSSEYEAIEAAEKLGDLKSAASFSDTRVEAAGIKHEMARKDAAETDLAGLEDDAPVVAKAAPRSPSITVPQAVGPNSPLLSQLGAADEAPIAPPPEAIAIKPPTTNGLGAAMG